MKTAVVTGASRGVGKGIAISLDKAGYRVYATGRTVRDSDLPATIVRVPCDHTDSAQTAAVFERVAKESNSLDILVNSAWGGYEKMVDNGEFTWDRPFWEQPRHRWISMMEAGVHAAFECSCHAARLMLPQRSGLIVHISFWAAQKYMGNVIYGLSKAASDKMAADMAHELLPHGISAISLYPGLVRTESVLEAAAQGWFDLANSESTEFCGLVIDALAKEPHLIQRSGKVLVAAEIAKELDIPDVNGYRPIPATLETA